MVNQAKEINYDQVKGPLDTSCFICTSHVCNDDGYPMIKRDGSGSQHMHRYLYQLLHGELVSSIEVHHLCQNKQCINIQHLVPKNKAEHLREHFSGEGQGASKLTQYQVKEILGNGTLKQEELAQKYGVSRGHISQIKTGRRWAYLQ